MKTKSNIKINSHSDNSEYKSFKTKTRTEGLGNWEMMTQRMGTNPMKSGADSKQKEQANRFRKTIILLSKTRKKTTREKKSVYRRMELNQAEASFSFEAEEVLFQQLAVCCKPICNLFHKFYLNLFFLI